MSVSSSIDPIVIYQKNFAFTSSDSAKSSIETCSFGPCYVVVFRSGKYAAMAHMDDTTSVKPSFKSIFDKFHKQNIQPKDIKVTVMGGWKEHHDSKVWGDHIIQEINNYDVTILNTQNMYKKKMLKDDVLKNFNEENLKSLDEEALFKIFENIDFNGFSTKNHYFKGARVDAKLDKVYILNELNEKRESDNRARVLDYNNKFGSTAIAISEISS